jgi:hypothetical protein
MAPAVGKVPEREQHAVLRPGQMRDQSLYGEPLALELEPGMQRGEQARPARCGPNERVAQDKHRCRGDDGDPGV